MSTFRPDFADQHFNMWTPFRREIANIQHPHLGRSKTTSVGSLSRAAKKIKASFSSVGLLCTTPMNELPFSIFPGQVQETAEGSHWGGERLGCLRRTRFSVTNEVTLAAVALSECNSVLAPTASCSTTAGTDSIRPSCPLSLITHSSNM